MLPFLQFSFKSNFFQVMKSKIFAGFVCVMLLLIISCKNDRSPREIRNVVNRNISESEVKIDTVNFFYENSLSTLGYLNGDNFLETMTRILGGVSKSVLKTYFINTKVYEISNLLDKLEKKKVKVGDIGSSNHEFIFTKAIENAKNNNLSIVVTDGIYSVKNSNLNIVKVKIEQQFVKSLLENEIETMVLKMRSNFKGSYYFEAKKMVPKFINQERPYYIFLFGNSRVIDKALNELVILDDLPGSINQARFLLTKNLRLNYSILTLGEEKIGSFRPNTYESVVKEIGDAERCNRCPANEKFLQFGIAIDFNKLAIPESYLMDKTNYSIRDNTGYSIAEIKRIEDLSKNSITYKWIEKENKNKDFKYSHIIVVKANSRLHGDLSIALNNNTPGWIEKTGTDDDKDIKTDYSKTYAFNRIMDGVSKAYQKVNKKQDYFKLNLSIKLD